MLAAAKPLNRWKLRHLFYNYDFFFQQLIRLIEPVTSLIWAERIANDILDTYINKKLSQPVNINLEIPYGTLTQWLNLVEGLVHLQTGMPQKYFGAYEELIKEKEKCDQAILEERNRLKQFSPIFFSKMNDLVEKNEVPVEVFNQYLDEPNILLSFKNLLQEKLPTEITTEEILEIISHQK